MRTYLKNAPPQSFADTAQDDVAERVRAIIADVRDAR